jgi:Zn-dependent protease
VPVDVRSAGRKLCGACLSELTLSQVTLRLCAILFLVAVHGASVAATAYALGDKGPRYDGRLRVNPLAHLDLLGLLSGVLFSLGWSKPVAIDPGEMRLGRLGLVLVVIAAAVATLGVALALRLARPWILPLLGDTSSTVVFSLIDTIGQLGAWFALINLVPLPPLTGSHLLTALVPRIREPMSRIQLYAALLLLGLAATGLITRVLAPADHVLVEFVLGE